MVLEVSTRSSFPAVFVKRKEPTDRCVAWNQSTLIFLKHAACQVTINVISIDHEPQSYLDHTLLGLPLPYTANKKDGIIFEHGIFLLGIEIENRVSGGVEIMARMSC